jgi:GNAT superfamily N-acetyltransferase
LSKGTNVRVRAFEAHDAEAVARLFADYMEETYGAASPMSAAVLLIEGQGHRFNLVVAADSQDEPIGFAAWRDTYDLHNAVSGGEIPDLFVERRHRGRALSLRLVAAIARAVAARGGVFLTGQVLLDERHRQRLVHRLKFGFPGESVYVSGRAMRSLAELVDLDARTLLKRLPSPSQSKEP